MFDKEAVCLEIGSSKLRVIVASEGVNNTLVVKECVSREYDGFFRGEFVDGEKLGKNLFELFNSIDYKKKKYNKKIYISLPAEMTKVVNATASIELDGIGKASKADVENLKYQASIKAKPDECEVVTISPIKYLIDDNQVDDVVGKKGRSITGCFSLIICEKSLIEKLNSLVSELGFSSVEYLSEVLCQSLFVIPEEERKDGAILIDVGHLTTSVAFVKNEGINSLTSFSIGGGHITSDLCEAFDLAYEDAEKLKRMCVISVAAEPLDYYDLPSVEGRIQRIPEMDTNQVVSYRLETIASAINQCLIIQDINISNYVPIYLTGGGVSKIKGGRDFLSKCLGRNVAFGRAPLPGKNKPEDALIYSIAWFALKNCD